METFVSGRLPLNLSSFVGREHEIAQVAPLIVANRLVTLTGSGGAGKTRLAFEVAARLRSEFSEGIRVVELASLSDPGLVLSAVGRSAGFFDPRGHITLERLAGYLEDRDLLLILDNCEHLAAGCAEFAQSLLAACCLDLRILCTSREPLGVPGEITWRVPPLAIPPSLAHIDSFDAVRLFVERAQAAVPDFALTAQNATAVAEICRRLDGIPLAIELAAARVRLLTVEQIAQRLGDALGLLRGSRGATLRHRTMRAAIDWSYGSLDEPDAAVLRRLSVFSGGASLAGLEFVCADIQPDSCEIVDSLARLVDKSLVIPRPGAGDMCYHMLEVIRQFAAERLEERGETEQARERHLAYYLALAERVRPELRTSVILQRLDLLGFEHDNLRAAMQYALQAAGYSERSAEKALRLASALEPYWQIRGPMDEGMAALRAALAARTARAHPTLRAQALANLANLALYSMGQGFAQPLAEESIILWRRAGPGNAQGLANATRILGVIRSWIGDYAGAREPLGESLRLFREAGDELGEADVLCHLGATWLYDDNVLAKKLNEHAIAIYERYDDPFATGSARYELASVCAAQGDFGAARSLFEVFLTESRRQGSRYGVGDGLFALALVSRLMGDMAAADAYYSEQMALDSDNSVGAPHFYLGLAYVRHSQGEREQAIHLLRRALTCYQKMDCHGGIAASLVLTAEMKRADRCPKDAAQLLGAAKVQLPLSGRPYSQDQNDWDRCVKAVRSELGANEFDAAWSAGERMNLSEALQLAFRPGGAEPAADTTLLTPLRAMKSQYGGLTAREREVAACVSQGLCNREIAEGLVLSERTVEAHIGNVLGKLELSSRTQIATWALEKGLARASRTSSRADSTTRQ